MNTVDRGMDAMKEAGVCRVAQDTLHTLASEFASDRRTDKWAGAERLQAMCAINDAVTAVRRYALKVVEESVESPKVPALAGPEERPF